MDCASASCPLITGSCCIGSVCTVLEEATCQAVGGEFGGEGSPCENASCAAPCLGDFTNDDAVGFDDLLYLLSDWAGTEADLDGSGVTDFADVLILLAAYGPC